ncbi:hypothetical protein OIO90_001386 [Microbotryomycetes sp. JL221]|nr:hypothetical protein OIO90_001386 [Microbotryomycetes sp. JL221]
MSALERSAPTHQTIRTTPVSTSTADSGDKPAPVRPFKCTQCDQAYARSEHLDRHARTHIPGSKYPCNQCGREFARSDVLKRHKKLHERDGTDVQGELRNIRKQAALERSAKEILACVSCASSKVKCSGDPTCARCVTLGKECVYAAEPQKRPQKRARASSAATESASGMSPFELPEITSTGMGDSFPTSSSIYTSGDHHESFDKAPDLPPLPPVPTDSTSAALTLPNTSSDQYTFDHLLDFAAYAQEPAERQQAAAVSVMQNMANITSVFNLPPTSVTVPQASTATSFATQGFDFFGGFLAVSPPNMNVDPSGALTSPAFDPGLQLPNDDSLFWSAFVSPPGNIQGGIDLSSPGGKFRQKSSEQQGKIDTTAGGLATRHASPEPGAEDEGEKNRQWPMVWNPSIRDTDLHLDAATTRELETNGSGLGPMVNLPKFDEETRLAMLETLRFARLSDHEYHALYRSLSKIKLQTYDLLLSLYFRHFHPNMPFLHMPTFNPRTTPAYLLLELIGVGALHAPFPGSLQLGRVLLDLGRRVIEELTTKDNRHARVLPMTQTMLIWGMTRYIGSPRSLELTEVFQGVCVATLRRLKVFDEPIPVSPPTAPVAERWHSYIKHEERRRTGMACFLLESEFSTLLHHPSLLQTSDLNTCLPSPESLWNAPDADIWNDLTPTLSPPLKIGAICKVVTLDTPFSIPQTIRMSPFGAHVLVRCLHLNVFNAAQFASSGMSSIADVAKLTIRRALGRLGRGSSEYTPTFGAETNESEYSAARVSYHLAHIETHVNGADLDTLAGLGTLAEVTAARARLTNWMSANPEAARSIAVHAGQLIRMIRNHPTYGTYEPCSLFYATLCLYVYSRSLSSAITPAADAAAAAAEPFSLDGTLSTKSDPTTWVASGTGASGQQYYASLESVGSLSDAGSAIRVLTAMAAMLNKVGAVWRIGQVLSTVVDGMAREESVAGSTV